MPELPEVALYVGALERRLVGQPLEGLRIRSPSLLRTFDPPASALVGRTVRAVGRLQKRIVLEFEPSAAEEPLFAVVHLMITGRFQWQKPGATVPRKTGHAAFDFADGSLLLTEQATRKRASLHVVQGAAALAEFHRGGVEPLEASLAEFAEALRRENRTLKRALTDPRLVSGVGNAHSDEILLGARLSPVQLTQNLSDAEVERLYQETRDSLTRWTTLLREEWGDRFPTKVTAFHPEMVAHGKYGQPCPQCGSPIQRIRYADRETNYCPTCQTGGKLLADRALSRLLGKDWPRTLEEMEEHIEQRSGRKPE
ncbi:MAG: DNA-formamidopyrimidine glycosylase family protein [Gemmatimonadota bacterium]